MHHMTASLRKMVEELKPRPLVETLRPAPKMSLEMTLIKQLEMHLKQEVKEVNNVWRKRLPELEARIAALESINLENVAYNNKKIATHELTD